MSLLNALGVARWGASEKIEVPAATTREVSQFVDVSLWIPHSVDLVFYATSNAPVAGLSVRFLLQIGNGSTNHKEVFTMLVQDELAQAPLIFRRAAQRIQISAEVINTLPETRQVTIVAMTSPVSLRLDEMQ